jgi:ATP-dependent Clp protease ATP-binding subunit ClpA
VPDNLALMVLQAFTVSGEDIEADLAAARAHGRLSTSDAAALATLGIDLDEVRRQVEEAFGPGALDRTRAAGRRGGWFSGHIPFGKDAKKVLELALREAIALEHNYIGCEHILLGMLHAETGTAGQVLRSRGVRQDAARIIVEELLRRRRAG